jgi:hypothetical protein
MIRQSPQGIYANSAWNYASGDLALRRIVPVTPFGNRKQPTIAQCLGHMPARDSIHAFEISQGASDPKNPMVAPRREAQPFDSP